MIFHLFVGTLEFQQGRILGVIQEGGQIIYFVSKHPLSTNRGFSIAAPLFFQIKEILTMFPFYIFLSIISNDPLFTPIYTHFHKLRPFRPTLPFMPILPLAPISPFMPISPMFRLIPMYLDASDPFKHSEKKWSQTGASEEPFRKTAPLCKEGPFFPKQRSKTVP